VIADARLTPHLFEIPRINRRMAELVGELDQRFARGVLVADLLLGLHLVGAAGREVTCSIAHANPPVSSIVTVQLQPTSALALSISWSGGKLT
jgi:hypothetical protein